jgi:hypothetical protein
MEILPSDCVFILHYLGKKIITEERIIEELFKVSETQHLTLKEIVMVISKYSPSESNKEHETEKPTLIGYAFCLMLIHINNSKTIKAYKIG